MRARVFECVCVGVGVAQCRTIMNPIMAASQLVGDGLVEGRGHPAIDRGSAVGHELTRLGKTYE